MLYPIGIVILCLNFSGFAWAQGDNPRHLQAGVIKVMSEADGKRRVGTGFLVKLRLDLAVAVTAAHVVEGAQRVEVEFFTDRARRHQARVIAVEGGDDNGMAALLVQGKLPAGLRALRLDSTTRVSEGTPIFSIGFPRMGGDWVVSRGELAGRRARLLSLSGAIDEGNSGGPVLWGQAVIGMIASTQEHFSFALPSVMMRYVLESWGIRASAVQLRAEPGYVYPRQIAEAIRRNGLSNPGRFDDQDEFLWAIFGDLVHEYEIQEADAELVVRDHATGLMWQRGCSSQKSGGRDWAQSYISQRNQEKFAGYADWRLPTIEELASLLEPTSNFQTAFVAKLFQPCDATLLSADLLDSDRSWVLSGATGTVTYQSNRHANRVRMVRTLD